MKFIAFFVAIIAVIYGIKIQRQKKERLKVSEEISIPKDTKQIIKNWVISVDNEKSLSDDIVALNFGLFEGTENYQIYITGAKVYDENDNDWACVEDFKPSFRYCPDVPISTASMSWEEFLNKIIILIKEVIKETPDLRLWKVEHITVGFDDGDLVKIK